MKDNSARLVLYLVLAGAGIWIAIQLQTLIICFIAALTLAASLAPLAERLEEKKIPRVVTVILVYATIAMLYVLVGAGLVPILKEQAASLFENTPGYVDWLTDKAHKLNDIGGPDLTHTKIAAADVKQISVTTLTRVVNITGSVFSSLINGFFILFLTAYFVVAAKDINAELLTWLPSPHRERWTTLIRPIESRLGGYVRGQLLVSLAVGTFIGVGLALIGNEKALILGVLAGLLNLVPFVGSIITSVFAIIVSFIQAPWMGVATIVLFVFEQWVESNFIVPMLLGKQVDLHPLVVMLAVVVGGTLMGLSGALIAVPVATLGIILAEEFYKKNLQVTQLEDVVACGGLTAEIEKQ